MISAENRIEAILVAPDIPIKDLAEKLRSVGIALCQVRVEPMIATHRVSELRGGDNLWTHSKGSPTHGHRSPNTVTVSDADEEFPAPSDFSQGRYNCRGEYVIPKRR